MKYASAFIFVFLLLSSGAHAQFLFGDKGPSFYKNGSPVSSVVCGETITFDVPGVRFNNDGQRKIWLYQYRTNLGGGFDNLVKTFDGPYDLPMSEYETRCGFDEGLFHNYIYEAVKSEDGYKQGNTVIGYTPFSIGTSNEIKSSVVEKREDGIFLMKVSRNDPVISSGYFYADAAIENFLKKYTDEMDVIVLVPTNSLLNSVNTSSLCDCSWRWRYPALGIGEFPLIRVEPYNGPGRFFHVVQVPGLNEFAKGNKSLGETLWLLSHEIAHGWSSYYEDSQGMLDEFRAHWSKTFAHNNSIMGRGYGAVDLGNGIFDAKPSPVEDRVFNDFDLYNMGLSSASQVLDSFSVIDPILVTKDQNPYFGTFSGEKRVIKMSSLINSIGTRNPLRNFSEFNQTKNLRITFLVVQGPTGTESEVQGVQGKVGELWSNFTGKWNLATRNLSSVSVFSPLPKVSQKKTESFFVFLKNAIFSKAFSASSGDNSDLKEIISNIDQSLSGQHNDDIKQRDIDVSRVNFDGDDRLRTVEASQPNTSLAPLNTTRPATTVLTQNTSQISGLSLGELEKRLSVLLKSLERTSGRILCEVPSITIFRRQENVEVTKLQKFLSQFTTIYPEQSLIGYFGPATERAVRRFQEIFGLSTENGTVGEATRAKMRFLCSG